MIGDPAEKGRTEKAGEEPGTEQLPERCRVDVPSRISAGAANAAAPMS